MIEQLVLHIAETNAQAFRIKLDGSGRELPLSTVLSKHFTHIQQLIDHCNDDYDYDYSEDLQAFVNACSDIGLCRSPKGPACMDSSNTRYLSHHQSMNVLVDRIRQLTLDPEYQRKAYDRKYQANKKATRIEQYVQSVLNRYYRTMVIRVDLHYLEIAKPRLRVEHVLADLKALIRARERNPIFDHETGYIWRLEQGKDRGFHLHTAFFFNGAFHRNDWHKAQEIGELWKQITGGHGSYYSCNAAKNGYPNLGIGMINRNDAQGSVNVIRAMAYLSKDRQHLRLKPALRRSFGMGL